MFDRQRASLGKLHPVKVLNRLSESCSGVVQTREASAVCSGTCWALMLLSGTILAACSGGDSPSMPAPGTQTPEPTVTNPVTPGLGQDQTPTTGVVGVVGDSSGPSQQAPDDLTGIDRVTLTITTASRCSVVGNDIDLNITRALTDDELAAANPIEPPVVTAFVTLTQSLGTSLQLLSRTDDVARFTLQRQDIVGLTAELDNGSVTTYLAGFDAETSESVVLRKPVVGGCLYAVRLPDYCATGLSKGGTLNFNRDGLIISAQGCDMQNPTDLPVVELPPVEN